MQTEKYNVKNNGKEMDSVSKALNEMMDGARMMYDATIDEVWCGKNKKNRKGHTIICLDDWVPYDVEWNENGETRFVPCYQEFIDDLKKEKEIPEFMITTTY